MSDTIRYDQLRARIEKEDQLLNARTGIFLVTNGLTSVAAAIGIEQKPIGKILVATAIVTLDVLWLLCSLQSRKVLRALAIEILPPKCPEHPVEKVVQEALGNNHFIRPTTIIAVLLPLLAIAAWLAGLSLSFCFK